MTLNQGFFTAGYFLLFVGSVVCLLWWHKRQRKTRLPFGEEMKLLRTPGETQLKLTRKYEEDETFYLVMAAIAPVAIGTALLFISSKLPATLQLAGLLLAIIGFVGTLYLCARWIANRVKENSNRYLGYFGERIVAEHLEPLKLQGWRVFHDVPCVNNGTKFNIDHVAVGPTGVFVVETKTRRKGKARPGRDDHKVFYDGRVLDWPWGEDNHGLEQAERNSVWLSNTLERETGQRPLVAPILTLPGWWVENKPARDSRLCRVTNPKGLARYLSSGSPVLEQEQVDAIAAKLAARCRDVEF